ncbi:hypothetical protein ACFQ60_28755 [Streptomyces zhihengii]
MNRQTPGISPSIVTRDEQVYAYIRGSVRMDEFAVLADRLPELVGWLAGRGTPSPGRRSSGTTPSTWTRSRSSRPACP